MRSRTDYFEVEVVIVDNILVVLIFVAVHIGFSYGQHKWTAIKQHVVATNLSWRKEVEELVPACKSVCVIMHVQTKPVRVLLLVYVAAALWF